MSKLTHYPRLSPSDTTRNDRKSRIPAATARRLSTLALAIDDVASASNSVFLPWLRVLV